MTAATNVLAPAEMGDHLSLIVSVSIWEINADIDVWRGEHAAWVYDEVLRLAQQHARELNEHLAFGPPLLTEHDGRALMLTWPLAGGGRPRSEVLWHATRKCTCNWHRAFPDVKVHALESEVL